MLGTGELAKLATLGSCLELCPDLAVGRLSHPSPQCIAHQHPLIDHGLTFVVARPRVGDGLPCRCHSVRQLLLAPGAPPGFRDHPVRLVAVLGCQFFVRRQHLGGSKNLLAVAGRVSGDLRGGGTAVARLLQMLPDLLRPQARCIEVLLRVAFDLRRAASSGLDLIAELAELRGQFRLVDRRRVGLGLEITLRLDGTTGPIGPLGDVEHYGMSVELRRGIPVHRSRRIVFKLCGNKLAGRLGWIVAADPRLRVPLQFRKRGRDR